MSELARESRALLEAARSGDDPRAEDRARIRQRLFQAGVGAAVMTATTSTTASVASSAAGGGGATGLAGGVASSAVGGGVAAATGAASMGVVAKVLVALAITGTLSATGVKAVSVYRAHEKQRVALLQAPESRALAASALATPGAATTPAAADPASGSPAAADPASGSPVVVAAAPVALPPGMETAPQPRAAAVARTPRRAPEAPAPESTLESETRLLQDAEKRRRAGDGEGALSLLAEHASRFPHGVLTEERAAARVFTLCDLGRSAEARVEGERFLQDAPRSPLAARVRASCARRP
jgi:hypothetical protein